VKSVIAGVLASLIAVTPVAAKNGYQAWQRAKTESPQLN